MLSKDGKLETGHGKTGMTLGIIGIPIQYRSIILKGKRYHEVKHVKFEQFHPPTKRQQLRHRARAAQKVPVKFCTITFSDVPAQPG